MIKEYINKPYPQFESKWKLIISISLFIALFMLIFQPFGLSDYHNSDKILITAGYGCLTFVILIINLFVVSPLLRKWFNAKSWTVIKQIFWLIWIIFTIGLGNYLYTSLIFSFWSLYGLLVFQVYTLLVGIIPIVVLTILLQNILLTQNLKSARDFNSSLINKDDILDKQIICLIADNLKDKFEVELSNLLYIESTGNYIEIFYVKDDKLKNTILRCTLKRTEIQLETYPSLVKCHRAFLININKIIHAKGNSQGLKLILKNTEKEIPVSRNLSKSLKDKISSYK
jgi:hypothetical protein